MFKTSFPVFWIGWTFAAHVRAKIGFVNPLGRTNALRMRKKFEFQNGLRCLKLNWNLEDQKSMAPNNKLIEVPPSIIAGTVTEKVSFLRGLQGNDEIAIFLKKDSVNSQWIEGVAARLGNCWKLRIEEGEEVTELTLPDEDESRSLFEENLWKIGWYDFCPSSEGTTTESSKVPEEDADINATTQEADASSLKLDCGTYELQTAKKFVIERSMSPELPVSYMLYSKVRFPNGTEFDSKQGIKIQQETHLFLFVAVPICDEVVDPDTTSHLILIYNLHTKRVEFASFDPRQLENVECENQRVVDWEAVKETSVMFLVDPKFVSYLPTLDITVDLTNDPKKKENGGVHSQQKENDPKHPKKIRGKVGKGDKSNDIKGKVTLRDRKLLESQKEQRQVFTPSPPRQRNGKNARGRSNINSSKAKSNLKRKSLVLEDPLHPTNEPANETCPPYTKARNSNVQREAAQPDNSMPSGCRCQTGLKTNDCVQPAGLAPMPTTLAACVDIAPRPPIISDMQQLQNIVMGMQPGANLAFFPGRNNWPPLNHGTAPESELLKGMRLMLAMQAMAMANK